VLSVGIGPAVDQLNASYRRSPAIDFPANAIRCHSSAVAALGVCHCGLRIDPALHLFARWPLRSQPLLSAFVSILDVDVVDLSLWCSGRDVMRSRAKWFGGVERGKRAVEQTWPRKSCELYSFCASVDYGKRGYLVQDAEAMLQTHFGGWYSLEFGITFTWSVDRTLLGRFGDDVVGLSLAAPSTQP
jgi:hypothetical protein